MQFTTDKIVEYLNLNMLCISKSSTEEDIEMMEFLVENQLMTTIQNNCQSINNEGKAYLANANIFNPVPLTEYEWMVNIIEQLKEGNQAISVNGNLYGKAYNKLIQDGIIEPISKSTLTALSSKGNQFTRSGLSYYDFLDNKSKGGNIHIGHNIIDIHDGILDFSNSHKQITNNNNIAQTKPIISFISWVIIIIGLISSIITIYLYLK